MKKLGLIIVVLLAANLLYTSMKSSHSKDVSSATSSDDKSGTVELVKNTSKAVLKKRSATISKKRKQYVSERRLGLKSHSFPVENGKMKVIINFKPITKWCEFGDLDYMEAHLEANKKKTLVLSVENITEGKVLTQKQMSIPALKRGGILKLDIPVQKNNSMAGIFICSTPKGKKYACRNKPGFSFSKLENVKSSKSSNFYFQSVFLSGSEMKVPPTLANMNNKGFYRDLGNFAGKSQKEGVRYTQKLSAKMGSIPPNLASKTITIPLPLGDPRCPTIAAGITGKLKGEKR